jgi:hypothetical protein
MNDIPKPGVSARLWGVSEELHRHFLNMGVVQTMVCQLSKTLSCAAELDVVATERNRRASESFKEYAKLLYRDAMIVGTVLDSDLSRDDPILALTPGKVMRLPNGSSDSEVAEGV